MLERNQVTIGLAGKYVDTYAFADGGLEVRWQGLSLPYKAFDKDQRVSHAAIALNKGWARSWPSSRASRTPAPPCT
jgi:hypothetical protein